MNAALLAAVLLAAPTIIDNVRVENGTTVIDSATVTIDQGRVVSVTPGKVATAIAGHIDGTGKVLTAGLIETRSQLGFAEVLIEG